MSGMGKASEVFPMPMGMNRSADRDRGLGTCVPHAYGDEPPYLLCP